MIVCDEYLALAALTNNLPQEISHYQIAVTPVAYGRLLRRLHNSGYPDQSIPGQISQLVRQMSPNAQAALIKPDPRVAVILDTRPYLNEVAKISVEYGLSWMAAEMAAAAIHHRALLYYGTPENVPPRMHTLLTSEELLGIRVSDVWTMI